MVLNSGFCVLNGIVELKMHVAYGSALIRKHKYWPKYIKGELIKEHFNNKPVRDCNPWKGSMDEVNFHVYPMKELDYIMSLCLHMAPNLCSGKGDMMRMGGLQWDQNQTTFNYPEVVGNHYLYHHSIYDHNNKWHSPISLEVVWATKYWPKLHVHLSYENHGSEHEPGCHLLL